MTSVKEFNVVRPPTDDELGVGTFLFTDDYSVFDWGPMPDAIPDKGASLCTMGAVNFELLEDDGVPTHYEGVVIDDGWDPEGTTPLAPVSLAGALDPPTQMAIQLARVPELPYADDGYDYDAYHGAAGSNYLVPLEVVFRNRVGVGSSLRDRSDPEDHGLDHEEWPDRPVDLPEPLVEFSTKYEEQDRYLSRPAADRLAGTADVDDLEALARQVNRVVTDRADAAGLVHEDGKIECVYADGELLVADVVGTFDENRFSYDGLPVSKEVLRQYHKRTQPEWVDAVSASKATADERDVADWKSLCDRSPRPLDADVVEVARDLYAAGTNVYTGDDWFDAPSLDVAVDAARSL